MFGSLTANVFSYVERGQTGVANENIIKIFVIFENQSVVFINEALRVYRAIKCFSFVCGYAEIRCPGASGFGAESPACTP